MIHSAGNGMEMESGPPRKIKLMDSMRESLTPIPGRRALDRSVPAPIAPEVASHGPRNAPRSIVAIG